MSMATVSDEIPEMTFGSLEEVKWDFTRNGQRVKGSKLKVPIVAGAFMLPGHIPFPIDNGRMVVNHRKENELKSINDQIYKEVERLNKSKTPLLKGIVTPDAIRAVTTPFSKEGKYGGSIVLNIPDRQKIRIVDIDGNNVSDPKGDCNVVVKLNEISAFNGRISVKAEALQIETTHHTETIHELTDPLQFGQPDSQELDFKDRNGNHVQGPRLFLPCKMTFEAVGKVMVNHEYESIQFTPDESFTSAFAQLQMNLQKEVPEATLLKPGKVKENGTSWPDFVNLAYNSKSIEVCYADLSACSIGIVQTPSQAKITFVLTGVSTFNGRTTAKLQCKKIILETSPPVHFVLQKKAPVEPKLVNRKRRVSEVEQE